MSAIAALLLDLDGTLLDTAPEMAAALNRLRQEERRPPLPFNAIRPTVSHGSIRMVRMAFSNVTADEFERLRLRFLDIYRGILGTNTRLFAGFDRVFERLDRHDIAWGVVTNKPGWLTEPLLHAMGLQPTRCLHRQRRYGRRTQAPSTAAPACRQAHPASPGPMPVRGRCRAGHPRRQCGWHADSRRGMGLSGRRR